MIDTCLDKLSNRKWKFRNGKMLLKSQNVEIYKKSIKSSKLKSFAIDKLSLMNEIQFPTENSSKIVHAKIVQHFCVSEGTKS